MRLPGVDLFSLPYDLQLPVVKKLSFKEFCRLCQCSFLALDLCQSRRFRLHFDVDEIFISQDKSEVRVGKETVALEEAMSSAAKLVSQQIVIKNVLTEEDCKKLVQSVIEAKTSAKKLVIWERPECEPDTLAKLMKILQIVRLETRINLGATFFEHDYFLELEDIALRCCSCECMVHFQVRKATITTQPQRPTAELVMRTHTEEEWKPQGGHLQSY